MGADKKRVLQEKEAEAQKPEALSIAWPERRTIHRREEEYMFAGGWRPEGRWDRHKGRWARLGEPRPWSWIPCFKSQLSNWQSVTLSMLLNLSASVSSSVK